ncbi:SusC/RagA family TonB-linked outer membrane protein [Butyricimonas hominis]|nr:SusC/RagA family TonB-linked outer membrane protein [Butyricimonas hominis]
MKKKYLKTAMAIVVVLLCILPLQASTLSPSDKLNFKSQQMTVEQVFDEISTQLKCDVFYNENQFDAQKMVHLPRLQMTLDETLQFILADKYSYTLEKNSIVIAARPSVTSKKITGTVKDEKGEPLPGVTILVKGTTTGAATDANGNYSLVVPKLGVQLIFSFIGMETQEITATKEVTNVVMKMDVNEMDEVVITGYQVIDKKKLTSAISSVKAKDVMIAGAMSIDQMLQGRVPDMMMMTNSGEVGVVPKIRIRGTSTLVGNREPLWVVDGIIVQDPVPIAPEELNDPDYINRIGNAIAGLNPRDIDRIDILKDASATAIYGVKAANGVIVITTKKGQVGRPVVSYDFSATYRRRPRYTDRNIHLMNSKQRVEFSKDLVEKHHVYSTDVNLIGYEGLVNNLYNGTITHDQFTSEVAKLENMNTDWFDLLTEDAFSHQHTVSISGGSEEIRYYSSIGYAIDNDVIKGNNNERYTAALNVDATISPKVTASLNLNANVGKREYSEESINPIDYAYTTSRAIPALDNQGRYIYYKRQYAYQQLYNYNILNELDNSYSQQDNSAITLTANLRYKATNWLSFQAIFSYSTSNTEQESYLGEQTWYAASLRKSEYGEISSKDPNVMNQMPYGGELKKAYTRNNSYTGRLQADISKYFGTDDQHNITANLGYEVSSSKYAGFERTDRGYYNDRGKQFTAINLDDFTHYKSWLQNNLPSVSDNLTNMISGYLSVSYSYKNYFTLNANTRIDGSNQFGSRSNEKLLPVWSVSGSYNISEHTNMDNPWVSNLALRLSYGYQGNMLSGQSPEMILKKLPFNTHYNELESNVSIYPNPDLRWERTSSFNVGLDFALFKNAVQMNASYYYKHTKDAFLTKKISSVNGRGEYVINSGTIDNQGFSIDATVSPISNDNFRWTLSASYSKVYNEMNTLPGDNEYELDDFLTGNALTKGHAVGTFWSYKFIGLNPRNGGPVFDDMQDRKQELVGLNKYDTYTMVLTPSGQRDPQVQGSLTNTLRYKSFRLSFILNYSLGSKIRLFGLYPEGLNFDPERNVNYEMVDRWRTPGDEKHTNIPNIINGSDAESRAYAQHWSLGLQDQNIQIIAENAWTMYDNSDHRVVSGNYLKCSNMSFTYDFPIEKLEKWGISMLSASLSTTNLFDIKSKKLKGQTPIQSGFSETQLSERPTWSLSLSVSF